MVRSIPMACSQEDLRDCMESFGTITRVTIDVSLSGKFALVEFADVASALDGVSTGRLVISGETCDISGSSRTAILYTPSNVVYGKPIAINRHIMAVNPSQRTSAVGTKRQIIMRDVQGVVQRALARISLTLPGL